MIGGGDLDPAAPPFKQTATSSDGGKTWTITRRQPNIGTVFGLSYAGPVDTKGRRDDGVNRNDEDANRAVGVAGGGHEDVERNGEGANRTVVVTGPEGAAWTPDEGDRWFKLPGVTGYWGVAFGSPKTAWLVGTDGRILRVDFSSR
jgi:hypothetical protein